MVYSFVVFLLSQPSDADFRDAWEIGSHLGPIKTDNLKLKTIELSSDKALKGRLYVNQRYDIFPKTTFPERGFLYLIKMKGRQ